jgi:polyhydroxyalkanoate synthesis regulator phasin
MLLDDIRKAIEAALSNLTPQRAQELAKGMLEPGAAKEQVSKTAAELMEWSHRNRERLREFVRHEISEQVKTIGFANRTEMDDLKKRVRALERSSGASSASKKPTTRKRTSRKPAARKTSEKDVASIPKAAG